MPIAAAAAVPHPPLILPEIGKGEEAGVAKTIESYREAMRFVAGAAPETVVIISPHADIYADHFVVSQAEAAFGDFARFGAPRSEVEADCDAALAKAIAAEAQKAGLPAGPEGERHRELDHGAAIPLVFLQQAAPRVKIVRIGLSGLPLTEHYRLGQCIAKAAGEKNVAVVASGDLSHKLKDDGPYGFAPEGPELDRQITRALGKGDFGALMNISPELAEAGAECGLRAFAMMAGALDGRPVEAKLLSYEGPFGVGYAVATFRPYGEDEARRFLAAAEAARRKAAIARQHKEDAFVSLARYSIESYAASRKQAALPPGLPPEMTDARAGVFVSLHKDGELRGCIGTTAPTTGSVAREILQNAVSAAFEDPRFSPVEAGEVDFLEINVDVLSPAEPAASEAELDPRRYGVIVSSGGRRGLLLPDLEGVDSVKEQIDIARRKAGIPAGAALKLERFEVIRHV